MNWNQKDQNKVQFIQPIQFLQVSSSQLRINAIAILCPNLAFFDEMAANWGESLALKQDFWDHFYLRWLTLSLLE